MIARTSRRPRALRIKRMLDLVGATIALVICLPILALAAAAIWFDSRRPIIYSYRAHGLDGKPFTVYKFRTMIPDANERLAEIMHLNLAQGRQIKIPRDPRVTRIGRFLRRTSLDELPALINVIKGEMSIVGPKCHSHLEYPELTPALLERSSVKPGITGLWQVMARNHPAEAIRAYYDRRYIEDWSLWLDGRILVRTVGVVLRFNGGEPEPDAPQFESIAVSELQLQEPAEIE